MDKFNFYSIHGTDNDELGTERIYKSYMPIPGPYPDFHRLEKFKNISEDGENLLSILKIRSNQSIIWRKALEEKSNL